MYRPPLFADDHPERIAELTAAHPLATVINALAGQAPSADHLPLQFDPSRGPRGTLRGHLARANPLWRSFAPQVLVIFHGPQAFVPSSWYAEPTEQVPTWNYAVAQATGRPRLLEAAGTLALLRDLVRALQPEGHPLPLDPPAPLVEQLLQAIVGFEVEVERWEVKVKLSQNREPLDRARVRDGLRRRARGDDLQVAAWMERLGVVPPGEG